ncbi:uncharacterized protein [Lepeophtheirus salmonis]|uniref:uncharacterized protein isoform X2 n=1 Tax=Lepeophtheirus salmonis TaxID=72036 RepID=UPI003AF3B858
MMNAILLMFLQSLVDLESYPCRHNSEKLIRNRERAKSPSVRFSRVAENRHTHSRSIQHVNDICKQRYNNAFTTNSSVSQSPTTQNNVLITTTATASETSSALQPVQMIFHSQKKKMIRISDTGLQQSEEDLILNFTRKQEFSEMNPVRLKKEETILKNIKKREMLDKIQTDSKSLAREKEEKNKIKENIETSRTKKLLMATATTSSMYTCSPPSPMLNTLVSPPHGGRTVTFSREISPLALEKKKDDCIDRKEMFKRWHNGIIKRICETYSLSMRNFSRHRAEYQPQYDQSQFVIDCLSEQNMYRERHQVQQLELDLNLCAKAQDWANILAHEDKCYHKNSPTYGENIFIWPLQIVQGRKLSFHVSGKDVATVWYKKGANYDFDKNWRILHTQAGQFSQMIWKGSSHFGCGKAQSKRNKLIVVGFYYPRGNIKSQFHENVLLPTQESE